MSKDYLHIPSILSIGKYFEIYRISEDRDKLKAKCLLCERDTLISGSLRVSTNFRTHLRRKHPQALEEFEKLKRQNKISGKKVKINNIPLLVDTSKFTKGGHEIGTSNITKQEHEKSKNEIFIDEISSHIDNEMNEDSISFTESLNPNQQINNFNPASYVEYSGHFMNENRNRKIPKSLIPGETEETKWLTTKQLERMALIQHINFTKIQTQYYEQKLKLTTMKN